MSTPNRSQLRRICNSSDCDHFECEIERSMLALTCSRCKTALSAEDPVAVDPAASDGKTLAHAYCLITADNNDAGQIAAFV